MFLRRSPGFPAWGKRPRVSGRGGGAAASPFSYDFVELAGLCILAVIRQQSQQTIPGERGESESPVSARRVDLPEPLGPGPAPAPERGAALGPGLGPRRAGRSGRQRAPSAARSQRKLRPEPPERTEPPCPALFGGAQRGGSPSPRPLPVSPQIPRMSPLATGKCPNPP